MTKKVLFVATVATHIKGFHEPYLKLLHDSDFQTEVASFNNLGYNKKIEYCDCFRKINIKRNPFKITNIKAVFQLKKIIDTEKYDIVHCHTPMGAVVARLASIKARRKYGTRVIYTAHGFHFFKGAPLKNWLLFFPVEKILSRYTDTLITINKEDYQLANKKFKKCKDIRYVPGIGINLNKFDLNISEKEKRNLKASFGLKSNDFVLIFPSRLDKNKNQLFLINCVEKVIKKYKNIHLLLPGNDELNGYYQNIVSSKNLSSNIHFLGRREDIPHLLKISDIAVSSSKREGLPVNVMEAFASGLPVVALNCRGMSDLVKDGRNGFLIDINDEHNIDLFVKKIETLYEDNELRNRIKKNNLNDIKGFSIDRIVKVMRKIYFE